MKGIASFVLIIAVLVVSALFLGVVPTLAIGVLAVLIRK